MGALNLPSAADIDRLTRRLRTVSNRLEGIEEALDRLQEGVDRLSDRLEAAGRNSEPGVADRVAAIEGQLSKLVNEVGHVSDAIDARPVPVPREQERLAVDGEPRPRRRPSPRASGRRRRRPPPRGARCAEPVARLTPAHPAGTRGPRARRGPVPARPRAAPRRRSARAWRRCRTRRAGTRPAGRGARRRRTPSPPPSRSRARRRRASAPPGRVRVVEEVGGDDEPGARLQAALQDGVGAQRAGGAERAARAVLGQRRLGGQQLPERELVRERAARPHAHEAAGAELDELLDHDRRAGAAHAGGLHRQRLAVVGDPAVAPEAAVVVEHLRRPVDQLLRQPQRAPGIAGQQHALGDVGVRAQVDRLRRHRVRHRTKVAQPWRRRTRRRRTRRTTRASRRRPRRCSQRVRAYGRRVRGGRGVHP